MGYFRGKLLRFLTLINIYTRKRWIKWPLVVFCTGILFLTFLYICIYLGVFGPVPSKKELSSINNEQATQVLDRNGLLIGKYYVYDRQPASYEDFPKHLINALVATEDSRFFEHDGIDNVSLFRVFIKTIILQDESSGGGSTITLQLAKNLFGRKDYPVLGIVVNKFTESIIAKRLEDLYTKEEILTLYLNTVPFPDNTYGIESASRKFFSKTVSDLSICESALLVGSLKANSYYNPRTQSEQSLKRRTVVLNQMAKYGYLSQDSVTTLKDKKVVLNYSSFSHVDGIAPYFREQVKRELVKILDTLKSDSGEKYDLYKDGLIVHTTLDYGMQRYAEEAMKEHLSELQINFEKSYGNYAPWLRNENLLQSLYPQMPQYKIYEKAGWDHKRILDSLKSKKQKTVLFRWEGDTIQDVTAIDSLRHYLKLLNTGMLSIDPKTGEVRAYIGGIDYHYFKYDHVSQSERQVGSTFKPIVYTAAIENGMDPCTYYPVRAVSYTEYDGWTPQNAGVPEEDSLSKYSLEHALSRSVNTIAVKVLNDVGISTTIEQAKAMGIKKEIPRQPSIALGTAQIKMTEMAGAFASYANESKPVTPFYISKIEDRYGNVLVEFSSQVAKEKAYRNYTRQVLLKMMKETVNSGTASRLRYTYKLRNDIAGKTGTTQDNKDGWFVGITPKLVTMTWVGNDNHGIGFKNTSIGQGANSALPIFAKFYQKLNADSIYNDITSAKFEYTWKQVQEDMDCEPIIRETFFERLFRKRKESKDFDTLR